MRRSVYANIVIYIYMLISVLRRKTEPQTQEKTAGGIIYRCRVAWLKSSVLVFAVWDRSPGFRRSALLASGFAAFIALCRLDP